ncbi:MAG: transcriptional regulator [Syntrophomonadaceae bacterium]|nr:transcriptional regulator [Syntrophomonadaceae bacterium]
MEFHEKLDFLMNITKTSNRSLAQHTFLDASHISRLRRGERKLVKEADYLKNMAAYLARQFTEEYQKKALLEALQQPAVLLQSPDLTAEAIYHWLLDPGDKETDAINGFLDGMAKVQFKKPASQQRLPSTEPEAMQADVALFYGNQGKRDAVLGFLSMVLESQQPTTLLLYSDESIDWLTEDLSFQASWANLMSGIVMRGHRIKMIHTINRNFDEMLEGLTKWLPLYMTGSIEPFYYPRKRDGVFQRTLFAAPGIAAVTSTSIENMKNKAVNLLLKDTGAVDVLAEEYNCYLRLCKPLMRIFTPHERLEFLATINEFEKESADAIIKAGFLSLATIPASVASDMLNRTDEPFKKEIMEYFHQRRINFDNSLLKDRFYEIVQLPDIEDIKAGKVEVGFAGLQETPKIFYRPEEFKLHLENIIQLLQRYDNYQFCINKENRHYEYRLYVKEDLGAIIIKTSQPYIVFAINESNMTAAFWDYLSLIYKENQADKKAVIKQLQKIVDEL